MSDLLMFDKKKLRSKPKEKKRKGFSRIKIDPADKVFSINAFADCNHFIYTMLAYKICPHCGESSRGLRAKKARAFTPNGRRWSDDIEFTPENESTNSLKAKKVKDGPA